MGDYTGRRRGRSASEPPRDGGRDGADQESGYYADEGFGGANYRDGYQEPAPDGYAAEYGDDYATDYAEPRFEFQQRSAPAHEQQQPYGGGYPAEQEQWYETGQLSGQDPAATGYSDAGYGEGYNPAAYAAAPYETEPYVPPQPEPRRGSRRGRPADEGEYAPEYGQAAPAGYDYTGYQDQAYQDQAYQDQGYQDQGYDPQAYDTQAYDTGGRRKAGRRRGAAEREPEGYDPAAYDNGYDPDTYPPEGYDPNGYRPGDYADGRPGLDAPSGDDRRPAPGRGSGGAAPNHLPAIAVAAVVLIASAFVSPKATAAVTVLLQAAAAFAVRDVLRLPGRRAAIVATLPAAAATVGTFSFSSDVAATAVVAGLGAGFVLAAGDMVLRTRRRGVQPGASRDLAATVTALLFAGMTGLLAAAARQSTTAVAAGGVLYGVLALVAARNRDLTASRAAVLGLPAAAAALAAYAAAILVA